MAINALFSYNSLTNKIFFYTESCTNTCLSNNLNELSCLFIRSASVLILIYGSVCIYDKRS